jgi:CheY-like chemotaxis protein
MSMSDARVVYVEDDASNRALMASIFARHFPNVRLEQAANGAAGLDLVVALLPRLLLLDGNVGDLTADQFVETLRPLLDSLPVIIVISGSLPPDSATATPGVRAHIMKPFAISQVVEVIRRYLESEDRPAHGGR